MLANIDGDYIPFIASYNKPNKKGEIIKKTLEESIKYADDLVRTILKDTKCDSYILALTVGKCFRYKIYPEYKGNRKYKQKLNYFKEIKNYLINKWGAIYNEELEADDIVNICRKKYKDSFIVSPDKDLLMLEGMSYNPKTREWFSVSKTQADHSFWTSMIVGDSADNIKGVKGLGPAYARTMLEYGNSDLLNKVLNSYLSISESEEEAIDSFYQNYKCLKVVDKWEGYNIPEPIKVSTIIEYESEKKVVEGE